MFSIDVFNASQVNIDSFDLDSNSTYGDISHFIDGFSENVFFQLTVRPGADAASGFDLPRPGQGEIPELAQAVLDFYDDPYLNTDKEEAFAFFLAENGDVFPPDEIVEEFQRQYQKDGLKP